jgi:hypothetical protein
MTQKGRHLFGCSLGIISLVLNPQLLPPLQLLPRGSCFITAAAPESYRQLKLLQSAGARSSDCGVRHLEAV